MQIIEALKKFNRKERYWLIRNALGPSSGQLGEKFRSDLQKVIGIDIPEDAWWSMDYHLDWLVGALALTVDREIKVAARDNAFGLVRGNQEDVDLVVAFGTTLILVEAKGDASWSNSQLNSKVPRLESILEKYHTHQSEFGGELSVYFVLFSPKKSSKLLRFDGLSWPKWMQAKNGELLWMPMQMSEVDEVSSFLRVTRCFEGGAVSKYGTSWKIN